MEISYTVEVPIGHRLSNYNGRCAHLHGHNYFFTVYVQGNVDGGGLVMDYSALKKVMHDAILDKLDHAMVLFFGDPAVDAVRGLQSRMVTITVQPSAENLATLVYNMLRDREILVTKVVVCETSKSSAIADKTDRSVRIKEVWSEVATPSRT